MINELLFALSFGGISAVVARLFIKAAGRRWGDHVVKDPITWIVAFMLAVLALTITIQLLAFFTGHLSGRL